MKWWRRANLVLRAITAAQDLEVARAAYQFQCSLVGNGSLNDDSFKNSQAMAKETFGEIVRLIHPWDAKTPEEAKQAETDQLLDMYKAVAGDPADPKYMAEIKANIAKLYAMNKQENRETDENRVNRLLLEQYQARQRRRDAARR